MPTQLIMKFLLHPPPQLHRCSLCNRHLPPSAAIRLSVNLQQPSDAQLDIPSYVCLPSLPIPHYLYPHHPLQPHTPRSTLPKRLFEGKKIHTLSTPPQHYYCDLPTCSITIEEIENIEMLNQMLMQKNGNGGGTDCVTVGSDANGEEWRARTLLC